MTKPIPSWIIERYAEIYRNVKCNEFNREEAQKLLEEVGLYKNDKHTNTFFSELQKKGWIRVEKDKSDSRRRKFRLVSPENAILNLEVND